MHIYIQDIILSSEAGILLNIVTVNLIDDASFWNSLQSPSSGQNPEKISSLLFLNNTNVNASNDSLIFQISEKYGFYYVQNEL